MKPHRDPAYLAHVRTLPCCVCGKCWEPSEAHHAFGQYLGGGKSLKGSDYGCVPLCTTCHRAEHDGRGVDPLVLLKAMVVGLARWKFSVDLGELADGDDAKARRIVAGDLARRVVIALFDDGR